MRISYDLFHRVAQYLEANAKDSAGQALLEQLRFVLEVNSAKPTVESEQYCVSSASTLNPKVQGQSTIKLRDFVS